MFTTADYIASINTNLMKQSDFVVAALKKVLSYSFDSAIDLLDFSTFLDPTRFELSIRLFSMDFDANEVFGDMNNASIFAGSMELLSTSTYHQVENHLLHDFFDFYEQHEEQLVMQEQQAFVDWFSACWRQAGGQAFHLPAYFGFHDETNSYDLQNERFVEDEEKWR